VNDIFGIPMSGILITLVALLAICLLSVAWVAWRRPVIFKLGVRNIPRRKAQTILIVVGLMLSTLIISAALGTGDTLHYSTTNEAYKVLGGVDEVVVYSPSGQGDVDVNSSMSNDIPASAVGVVDTALAGNENVDGVMPMLWKTIPAMNMASGLAEPDVTIAGLDPSRLSGFGEVKDLNGNVIDLASLDANAVVISEMAADKLDAKVGDVLTIYYNNQPIEVSVAGVGPDSILTGAVDFEQPGMVMSLERLQELTGLADSYSMIMISNTGGVRDGMQHTDAVVDALTPALAGTQLGIDPLKQDLVDQLEGLSSLFTTLFLLLGLFSIAAGILLIVLIFTMLAAERRSEMGMARAVGTQRGQLIQQFVAEGAGYAVLAGLVGAALGVAAAYGIGYGMSALLGDEISITPHVEPRSLLAAYCLGVVITFLAVVGSSWKISRLNVVAAVRDIPDVQASKRSKKTLLWGSLLLLAGVATTLSGLGAEQAFPFYTGMSLLPFGIALFARFFGAPSRPVFSAVGAWLLFLWLLPEDTAARLWGKLDGVTNMEMFFLSGIFIVIGATILLVQNLDVLLKGVSRLGGVFKSQTPAIRTAIAYPGASRGRTGMAIAMFSLIVFSLVMMSTLNKNYTALFLGDEAAAGWDVRVDTANANPVGDFQGTLQQNGIDTSGFTATGTVTTPNPYASRLRMAGDSEWKPFEVRGMNQSFIEDSSLTFGQRAEGYDSDKSIIQALLTQPNVAVVDVFALGGNGDFGGGGDGFQLSGVSVDDKTFAPAAVEVINPETGQPVSVTVIGVIDSKIGTLNGLYANQATIDTIYPTPVMTSYYVALADDSQSGTVAKQIESTMLSYGVQANSIQQELEDGQKQSANFLHLVEGFMGLGLIVGIAAVGVISFRSVVERRQQIGVLRALGFQRGMVSLSFLIETAFIVGMGVVSGAVLGLVLARNLFMSDDAASGLEFLVPWPIISIILGVTMAVALLMAWIPSRQAARIAPAEALRYE
jgi:putative ABC transport system permease protein